MSASFKIYWLVLVVLPILAKAQQEAPSLTRYTMEQGLADNWVHTALRDSKGFLWLGTEGGLSRFDGQRFSNFFEEKNNPNSLSNNTVRGICEDPDGSLWLAVLDGGVNHLNPASGKFESWKTDPNNPDFKGELTSIVQDGDLLWLGSYHHGLGCFDKKKRQYVGWYSYPTDELSKQSLQFNTVNHLIADRQNPRYLWLAAANRGIARFDKQTHQFEIWAIMGQSGKPGVAAMYILQDKSGQIWAGTWSGGIAHFDPVAKQAKTYPYDLDSYRQPNNFNRNVVLSVLEKGDGELWVATEDNGFGVFSKATGHYQFFREIFSSESPEVDRVCQGLYLDPQQRLWVLGRQGGVRVFAPQRQTMRYISLAAGGSSIERAEVTDFAYSPSRRTVFVATENSGCFEWSDENGSLVQRALPLPDGSFPNFKALLCDSRGNIWAGTAKTLGGGASLYVLRPGKTNFEVAVLKLQPVRRMEETVNDLLEDSKGNIWAATSYDGIYRIGPGANDVDYFREQENFAEGAPDFNKWWVLLNMAEAPNGHIWFALKSGGVIDFDPAARNFRVFNFENLLTSNDILSIEASGDGRIWVGTKNNGLQVFMPTSASKKAILFLSNEDGPVSQYLSAIRRDLATGQLWLTTYNGLIALAPTNGAVKVYGMGAGLRNAYLNGKGLAVVGGLGVLIGQPNGFCLLRNEATKSQTSPDTLRVVLSDFKVFNQSKYFEKNIRNASEVVLKPSENVFEFEFSAPTAPSADLVSYQFMLDGFDEKWYAADGRKSITYTQLPPGKYTLRVKALQTGNDFSPETTLAICILPHWWQTWWFVAALLFLLGLAVWAIIRYRTAQIRHEEQLKTAFYKELSEKEMIALRSQMNPHFIYNCLNSINNFIVRNNSQQAANYVTKFSRLIRLVLDNSQQQKIPLEKELEALRLYMDLEAMRFDGKFRYEVWVDDAVDEQYLQIPPLLVQPYVENAIWHGLMHKPEGGSVVVDVRLPAEDLLLIEITDDGVGRVRAAELESKTALEHKSQGTLITAERLHNLNPKKPDQGKVSIHDLVDEQGQPCGTRVVLEIPV